MPEYTEDDVVGTVELRDSDGMFDLPDRYAHADAFVYRDPSKTVNMPTGFPIDAFFWDPAPDANPGLAPDLLILAEHGCNPEVFRVTNPDAVRGGA